jgi:uncharacterized membrane-anchored protein
VKQLTQTLLRRIKPVSQSVQTVEEVQVVQLSEHGAQVLLKTKYDVLQDMQAGELLQVRHCEWIVLQEGQAEEFKK